MLNVISSAERRTWRWSTESVDDVVTQIVADGIGVPFLESAQTPTNASVTASTSADTPQRPRHNLPLQY
jgi:hypothetical protein